MTNPSEKSIHDDVVDLLEADHRSVEKLFDEIRAAGDPKHKQELVEQVTIELVKHSVAEEARVYPRIEARVSKEEAERLREEQAESEKTMKRLEKLKPDDAEYDQEVERLIQEITAHVHEEEGTAFPRLREAFTLEERQAMAGEVQQVKAMAPTRPHPAAPDRPPGDLLLGPVAGMFDRLRDAITKRGTQT